MRKSAIAAALATVVALSTVGLSSAQAATTSNETYTIQPGDTLYKISVAEGISLSSLEAFNPQIQNVQNLTVGQVVQLPLFQYIVQPGDTMYKISVAQNVSLTALEAVNPTMTDYTNLAIGQVINIPMSSSDAATSILTSTSSAPLTTSSPATASPSINRQSIIAYAKTLIGIPYVWGGQTTSGFDCSGFVQYVFNHFGITLPRESHDQATVGTSVSQSNLQPGDLLFFQNTDSYAGLYANHVTHVGIYIGNGAMIESSSSHNNEGVVIVQNVFSNAFYVAHYYGAKDVLQ